MKAINLLNDLLANIDFTSQIQKSPNQIFQSNFGIRQAKWKFLISNTEFFISDECSLFEIQNIFNTSLMQFYEKTLNN